MTSIRTILAALSMMAVGLVACSSSSDSAAPATNDPNVYIEGFNPGNIGEGYTRFATPVIENIEPGADKMWCQYVSKTFDKDTDVMDLTGSQSKGGHHIIMYATKGQASYGTSRECGDADMSRVIFLGGIGGEGATSVAKAMPPGTVFRVPAGYTLMANIHFINVTAKPIRGQGVLDLKMAPADLARQTMTLFTNVATDSKLLIPAHSPFKMDVTCKVQKDMDLFMFGNHLHEHGTAAITTLTKSSDNTKATLREDTQWVPHMTFDPNFTLYSTDAPLHIQKGDTVTTHCEWQNDSDKELRFPSEMCVGFGFFKGLEQIDCVDGNWGG